MSMMNRLGNTKNPYQGQYKKVLCVCSAGLLRSPTTAVILSQEPFNYNTRAAGVSSEYALVQVDQVLLEWADEVVCMEPDHQLLLERLMEKTGTVKPIICLKVPDRFRYRDPKLMEMIKESYLAATQPAAEEKKKDEGSSDPVV